jgi:hypothetical protein
MAAIPQSRRRRDPPRSTPRESSVRVARPRGRRVRLPM